MKPFFKLLLLLIQGVMAAELQAMDEAQARQLATHFIETIDPQSGIVPSGFAECSRTKWRMEFGVAQFGWSLRVGEKIVRIEERTSSVVRYTDGELESLAMLGPRSRSVAQQGIPYFASKEALVLHAKKKLDSIAWHHGSGVEIKSFPQPNGRGEVPRVIIGLVFSDEPHGFPSTGKGNFAVIGLDSLSGEVVSLQRELGWTYGPPTLKVTRDEAIAIASQHEEIPADPWVFGPSYLTISSYDKDLTPRAEQLCRNKELVLGYIIRGKKRSFQIAADNGELLCTFGLPMSEKAGARTAGVTTEAEGLGARARPPSASGNSNPWVLTAGVTGGGLGLALLAWRFRPRATTQ